METFAVGDCTLGVDEQTYIIAEAGNNHDGSLSDAKRLIDAAESAGADAVKFQTFRAEEMYGETGGDETTDELRETFASLEMPDEWIPELVSYCEDRSITFLSTPFDQSSADKLAEYVPAFKVASTSLSNPQLLKYLTTFDKPLFVSTGAHEQEDIQRAVSLLRRNDATFALLHCVSSYPTDIKDINVRAVQQLASTFDVLSGLSDHTVDPVVAPCSAVALGATVIEKHITLDSSREGPDHSMALEPDEFDRLVSVVRAAEQARGTGMLGVQPSEMAAHREGRRRLYAGSALDQGTTVSESDIVLLRPGGREHGLEPWAYERVIGRTTTKRVEQYEPLTEDLFE